MIFHYNKVNIEVLKQKATVFICFILLVKFSTAQYMNFDIGADNQPVIGGCFQMNSDKYTHESQTGNSIMAKFDESGNVIWNLKADGLFNVVDLEIDHENNIFLLGTFRNELVVKDKNNNFYSLCFELENMNPPEKFSFTCPNQPNQIR
jgi:hypothetical protein